MSSSSRKSVAVVGAGLAGLSAARALSDAGRSVVVFDKGRGPGGRTSVRRKAPWAFDHGAQYFTARDAAFVELVGRWERDGVVAPWDPRLVAIETQGTRAVEPSTTRYVGLPGMNSMAKRMAAGLNVRCGVRVQSIAKSPTGFGLSDDQLASLGRFDQVLLALPSGQAAKLCPNADLAEQAAAVDLTPCIAVMLGFEARLPLDFDAGFVNHGPLRWIARNSSKPGRTQDEAWVLHASPEWSREHWEHDRATWEAQLLEAFRTATGATLPTPLHVGTHRWRYSLADPALEVGSLWNPSEPDIALAGDWLAGSRVEGAVRSGWSAAERLLG